MSEKRNAALLIVGHGSTVNPDSSAPTLAHAAEIRRRNIFGDVQCAFWKEEPSVRALRQRAQCLHGRISAGFRLERADEQSKRGGGPIFYLRWPAQLRRHSGFTWNCRTSPRRIRPSAEKIDIYCRTKRQRSL